MLINTQCTFTSTIRHPDPPDVLYVSGGAQQEPHALDCPLPFLVDSIAVLVFVLSFTCIYLSLTNTSQVPQPTCGSGSGERRVCTRGIFLPWQIVAKIFIESGQLRTELAFSTRELALSH